MRNRMYSITSLLIGFLTLIAMLDATAAIAGTIYYGGATETVKIVHGEATLFRFPTEVKTISQASRFEIGPANSEEPDYAVLSVKPRFHGVVDEVVFLLSDGSVVKTKLVTVGKSSSKAEAIYDFKPKADLLDQDGPLNNAPLVNEIDLLKAMIRGHKVSGYKNWAVDRDIGSNLKGLKISLIHIYTGNRFNGYIYKLKNVARKSTYEIDVRNLVIGRPNLAVIASVSRHRLYAEPGKRESFLYLVAKSSAPFRKAVLPISVVKTPKK